MRKRLIRRERYPGEDRREELVRLTDAGVAKLREARPAWERALDRLLSRVDDKSWSDVLTKLPQLARLADEAQVFFES